MSLPVELDQAVIYAARVLEDHRPIPATDNEREQHPWKSKCACGSWWYDFNAHRAYLLADAELLLPYALAESPYDAPLPEVSA